MVEWFINKKQMVVFVEAAAFNDPLLIHNPAFTHVQVGSPIKIHSDCSMVTQGAMFKFSGLFCILESFLSSKINL